MPRQRTPVERSQAARIAIHTRWGTADPVAGTEAAREASPGSLSYWLEQTPADLPDTERHRRAEHLKKAYYARLALASAKARRAKAAS